MFLSFWSDYLGFLIVFVSAVAVIVLVFWLLTKPKTIIVEEVEEVEEEKPKVVDEEETIEESEADDSSPDIDEESIPEIITYIADTHNEEEESDEISSNLYEDEDDETSSDKNSDQKNSAESNNVKLNIILEHEKKAKEVVRVPDIEEILEQQIEQERQLEDKDPSRRYHVLYHKDKAKWYVKREGSEEVNKYLETQKEAIAYATIWALRNETTVVVHRKDGVIRRHSL